MNTDFIFDDENGEFIVPDDEYNPFMDSDDEEVWGHVMRQGIDADEYDPLAHR